MKSFQEIREHIVKVGGKYRLVSKSSGKNLGTYDSKAGAEKRERQVQYFKHMGENFKDGRHPEDKGDSARHGLKGKSAAELKKIRSSDSASPRKKQLAHWLLNFHHKEGYKPAPVNYSVGKSTPGKVEYTYYKNLKRRVAAGKSASSRGGGSGNGSGDGE